MKNELSLFGYAFVVHVSRESNVAVHVLAKEASSSFMDSV
jgi:hypothetical protein